MLIMIFLYGLKVFFLKFWVVQMQMQSLLNLLPRKDRKKFQEIFLFLQFQKVGSVICPYKFQSWYSLQKSQIALARLDQYDNIRKSIQKYQQHNKWIHKQSKVNEIIFDQQILQACRKVLLDLYLHHAKVGLIRQHSEQYLYQQWYKTEQQRELRSNHQNYHSRKQPKDAYELTLPSYCQHVSLPYGFQQRMLLIIFKLKYIGIIIRPAFIRKFINYINNIIQNALFNIPI